MEPAQKFCADVPLTSLLAAFDGAGGSESFFHLSRVSESYDEFVSHSWQVATWKKVLLLVMLKPGPPAFLIATLGAGLMMWIWQFGLLPGFLVPSRGAYPGALGSTLLEASRNYLFRQGVHQPVRQPPFLRSHPDMLTSMKLSNLKVAPAALDNVSVTMVLGSLAFGLFAFLAPSENVWVEWTASGS